MKKDYSHDFDAYNIWINIFKEIEAAKKRTARLAKSYSKMMFEIYQIHLSELSKSITIPFLIYAIQQFWPQNISTSLKQLLFLG